MTTVTASEFQKNFGRYKEGAQREPVRITSNGRASAVLVSIADFEEYQNLKMTRYAFDGEVTSEFEEMTDKFMTKHKPILDGLS